MCWKSSLSSRSSVLRSPASLGLRASMTASSMLRRAYTNSGLNSDSRWFIAEIKMSRTLWLQCRQENAIFQLIFTLTERGNRTIATLLTLTIATFQTTSARLPYAYTNL